MSFEAGIIREDKATMTLRYCEIASTLSRTIPATRMSYTEPCYLFRVYLTIHGDIIQGVTTDILQ
jgi:hypothetical protein